MTYKILLEDGKFKDDQYLGSVSQQQARVKVAIDTASAQMRPLVLHLHGGLVKREEGEELADVLSAEYASVGAVPLFPVWQSGFGETLRINYREAFDGRLAKWALKFILEKLASKYGLAPVDLESRSVGLRSTDTVNFSAQDIQAIEQELQDSAELEVISAKLVAAVNAEVGATVPEAKEFRSLLNTTHAKDEQAKREASTLKPAFFIAANQAPGGRGLIDVASLKLKVIVAIGKTILGVVQRYVNKTDHGLHATAIEELSRQIHGDIWGAEIWGFMKKDTADAFEQSPEHAGHYFLTELEKANPRPRVILVGHSAGSVFVCNLLAAAKNGKFEVVFLAPAVTTELFDDTITKHGHKVDQVRLFTMSDALERADNLVDKYPWLYPSSLLYLISGILEYDANGKPDIDKPVLGMHRFYDTAYQGRPHDTQLLDRVRTYLNTGKNRVLWSVHAGGLGLCTSSADHGFFDNDKDTIDSVKHIIAKGFELQ